MICQEACEYPGPALKVIGKNAVSLSFFDEMITRASGGEQKQACAGAAIEDQRCEKLFVSKKAARVSAGHCSHEQPMIEFQLMKGWPVLTRIPQFKLRPTSALGSLSSLCRAYAERSMLLPPRNPGLKLPKANPVAPIP